MDPLRIAAASPEGCRSEGARLYAEEVALNQIANKSLIHGLPNELLIATFDLVRHTGEISPRIETLKTLSCVCRRWRGLVIHTSSLWTRLDISASEDTWSLVLRRNPNGQLDFNFQDKPQPHHYQKLLHAFDSNTPRIRSVELKARNYPTILPRLLQGTTSSLRFLSVTMDLVIRRKTWTGIQIKSLSEGPTFLHLSLQDVQLPWNHPRLANLRHLHLACVRDVLPPPEDIHRILSLSPLLEELRLGKKRYFPTPTQSDPVLIDRMQQYPPIILHHLRRIVLQDLPPPLFILLLSTLRCSACREITAYPCSGDRLSALALDLATSAIKPLRELNVFKDKDSSIFVMKKISSGRTAGSERLEVHLAFSDVNTAACEQRIESLMEQGVLVHHQ